MLHLRTRALGLGALFTVTALLAPLVKVAPAEGPYPPQVPSLAEMDRLRRDLNSALGRVREARRNLDQVVAAFESANERLGQIAGDILVAQTRLGALDAELGAAQTVLNKRAASAYRLQRAGILEVLLETRTFQEFLTAFNFIKSAAMADVDALDRVRGLKAEATKARVQLEDQRSEQEQVIRDLVQRQRQVEQSLGALEQELKKVQGEIDRRRQGFAFPVRGAYSYTNSWGAPRMEGTSYYHRHEGTDIFALRGTPVVAVVDGVVERVGTATLGGIKLWLRSPGDGWTYFYAHLSGYASGIRDGLQVRKGDVVGYIGNTGNARGTPPHLHFETHVPAGPATNPYPILRRIDPLVS